MLNFISFSYLNNLTLERGGMDHRGEKLTDYRNPTERTLTVNKNQITRGVPLGAINCEVGVIGNSYSV